MIEEKSVFRESNEIRRWAGILLSEKPADIENMVMEDVYKLINERQLHQIERDLLSRELDRLPVDGIQRTFRELQVHQRELERQTEELCQAQLELEESRKRYFHLYHFAPVGYFTIDKNTLILDSNFAGAGQLGVSRRHLFQRRFTDFITPDYRDTFNRHCQQVFKNGNRQNCELKMVKIDGTAFYVQLETMAVVDQDGSFNQLRIAVMDVTKRKMVERELERHQKELEIMVESRTKALQAAQERFSGLYRSSKDAIGYADLNGNILDVNESFCELIGYSKEELLGKKYRDLTPAEYHEYENKTVDKVLRTGKPAEYEKEYLRKDGKSVPVLITTFIVRGSSGKPISLAVIIKDITRRKQDEEALRESEERYRALFEQAADSIVLIDADSGLLVDFNFIAHQSLGYTREEFARLKLTDLDITESAEDIKSHIGKIVKRGSDVFETQQKTKSGKIRYRQVCTRAVRLDGKKFVQAIWHDITERKRMEEALLKARDELEVRVEQRTSELAKSNKRLRQEIAERKQAEEALRESEGRYRSLFETMDEGVVLIAPDGQIVQANLAAERLLGLLRSEIESRNYIAPEWDILRPDGTPMPPYEMAGPTAMKELHPVRNMEMGVRRPDGSTVWINVSASPIIDAAGVLKGVVGTFSDITERRMAEEALRESEERLRVVFEFAPDGYYLSDLEGTFIDGNRVAENIVGYKKEELIGKSFLHLDLLDPQDIERAAQLLRQNSLGFPTGPDEFALNRQDGSKISVEISTYPVKFRGKPIVLGAARDITERKQAEEALRESEEKYRAVVERADDGIVIAQGSSLRFVNSSFANMLGYREDELIDSDFARLVAPEDLAEITDRYTRRLKGEDIPSMYETVLLKKNGEGIQVEASAALIRYEGKISLLAVLRDITERKRAEEVLEAISNSSPVGIYIIQDGKFRFFNPQFRKDTGYSEEELLSMNSMDMVMPEYKEKVRQNATNMLKGKRSRPYEYQAVTKNGDIRWTLETVAPIEYQGRQATLGNYVDITERKHAEQALRESQEKLQRIFEAVTDGVVVTDLNGVINEANEAALRLYRAASREELLGRNALEFIAQHDREGASSDMQQTIEEGINKGVEYSLVRADGNEFPGEISSAILRDKDAYSIGFVGVIRDLTERKQAEARVRDSEKRYRLLAENVADIIWTTDMNLNFTYTSSSVEWLLGYSPDEVIALKIGQLLTPDSLEVARQALLEAMEESELVRGENLRAQTFEFELTRKDGSTIWTETRMRLLRDPEDQPVGLLGVSRDITERKRAEEELRALSRRLVATQENERRAIGRELHDQIGQSLTVLKFSLEQAARSPAENQDSILSKSKTLLSELMAQVRNLSLDLRPTMLDDLGLLPAFLWHFGRYSTQTPVRVNFKHAGLRRDFPPEVGSAAYRIVQEALTNVARHAGVDKVTVRAWTDGDTLFLRVKDRGTGFDPAALDIGASSGLSGMRERARQLNGKITVESTPGTGTCVTAELPLSGWSKKRKTGGRK